MFYMEQVGKPRGAPPPENFSEMGVLARQERLALAVARGTVMPVRDLDHARSNEILLFCVQELKAGKTYNELRISLGLGPANVDRKWRVIRECLAEVVLPDNEEEALLVDVAQTGAMIRRMEEFLDKIEVRTTEKRGAEDEHHFFKLQLEAMKQVTEKLQARTEYYLKMKAIQKAEKRKTGTTIIFKNNFKIARPGDAIDVTPADAAQLIASVTEDDE